MIGTNPSVSTSGRRRATRRFIFVDRRRRFFTAGGRKGARRATPGYGATVVCPKLLRGMTGLGIEPRTYGLKVRCSTS